MNFLDLLAGAMMLFGYLRGRKRGFGFALYKLLRMGIPVAAGCGLFGLVRKLVAAIPGMDPNTAGLAGLLGGTVLALLLMRRAGRALRAHCERRFGTAQNVAAGLMGLARGGILALAAIVCIELSPAKLLTRNSFVAKTIAPLVQPEREATQNGKVYEP